MVEKEYKLSTSNEKTIEKVIFDENLHYLHMAFQIQEELFQRIKRYLDSESERTGKKVSQREFVLGLIQKALDDANIA